MAADESRAASHERSFRHEGNFSCNYSALNFGAKSLAQEDVFDAR
jgi:hypothetical protein